MRSLPFPHRKPILRIASIAALFLLHGPLANSLRAQAVTDDEEVVQSKALASSDHGPISGGAERLFELMPPEKTGVVVEFPIEPNHALARLYPYGWAAGGVAIGDINGDGRADLFFSGGPLPNRLYLQLEDFQFFDVSAQAGITGSDRWCSGAAMADIDNDGDLDIYVTCYAEPNFMFINQSQGNQVSFVEKAEELHLATVDGSLNAAFADFDRDGALDLYVQTYHVEPEKGRPEEAMEFTTAANGIPLLPDRWQPYYVAFSGNGGRPDWIEAGRPDYFFRNKGFAFYEDFSTASGIALGRAYGTSVTWADFDHNGLPDLFVGNDSLDPDLFYRNSGKRTFSQITPAVVPHTPWFTRGTVAADFNNDLLMDLLASNAGGRSAGEDLALGFPTALDRIAMLNSQGAPQVFRNTLLVNTGAARFIDVAWMAGLSHAGAAWSVKAGDFDNDGWIDAFFANGAVRDPQEAKRGTLTGDNLVGKTRWDLLEEQPERRESNLAFRNLGDLRFTDVSEAWGLNGESMSYGSATGDLDGDGDLDLVVCNAGGSVSLYRNRSTANRVRLRFDGKKSNTWGIGAEVIATVAGRAQMRQLYPQQGFIGSDEPVVHFGIGDAEQIDRLTIRWPSGAVETLENLEANHEYFVTEAVSLIPPLMRARRQTPMFAGNSLLQGIATAESPTTDEPQALAPPYLGRMGPGTAWADLDGDGKDELYCGGSRERSGRLITQSRIFSQIQQPFDEDRNSEDLGSVFFDADNDGDLDLYVVSGGPEAAPDSELLRDRLYLNNKLRFQKAPENHLPDLRDSGGPVAAADFDRDGDVDLFIGGRLVPGAYPTAPKSRLLVNDGKAVFSHTEGEAAAPGLTDSGMVSSAIWTDIDGDGWLDLVFTRDWGGIGVWKNTDGKLTDVSAEAGTAELLGRWNGIASGDLDQDGDLDYVVTNLGLNTGKTASTEQPLPIFYGDLVEDGKPLILETTRDQVSGKLLPSYGFEIWRAAVPSFGETFADSRAFAEAAVGLDGAFPADRRAAALKLEVNTLETGMLLNDGAGHFTFQPLPRLAQTAPSYGVVMTDVNADGRVDCYLVQNQDSPTISPDPADGGTSLLLLGTGNPENPLQPVWPDESGLVVFGSARSAAATDLDDDDRPDLFIALSEADPATFLNQVIPTNSQSFKVSLASPDHHAAGARVTVQTEGLPDQVAEYHAGSGHLSQSPQSLFFGIPKAEKNSAKVTIRWSDGQVNERTVYFE